MKAYKIYNFRGVNETFDFFPLADEICDEIDIEPAAGIEFVECVDGMTRAYHAETKEWYELYNCHDNGRGVLVAPRKVFDKKARKTVVKGWQPVAVIQI